MTASNFSVQAENQHVAVKVLDPHSEEARNLGLTAFSREGGLITPDTDGFREKVVVSEVLTAGPGNVSRGTLNPCTVVPGDLVLFNLYHRTHDILMQGVSVAMVNWENVMAKLEVNEAAKEVQLLPLQGYIVCKTNELRAQRIMMGASRIIAPYGDAQMSGNPETDEKGRPKLQAKTAVEDVVQQGPGAVVDGMWQEPSVRAGDAIMYDTSVSPVRFTISGQTFTLVHMRHVMFAFRDVGDETVMVPQDETVH